MTALSTPITVQVAMERIWELGHPFTAVELSESLGEDYPQDSPRAIHNDVCCCINSLKNSGKLRVHSCNIETKLHTRMYVPTGTRDCDLSVEEVADMIVERYAPGDVAFDRGMVAEDLMVSHDKAQGAIDLLKDSGVAIKTRKRRTRYDSHLASYHFDHRKVRL